MTTPTRALATAVLGIAALAATTATAATPAFSTAPDAPPALHALPATTLSTGDGDVDSVAVFANGRRALALVGDSDPGSAPALVSLDLTTSPVTVLGADRALRPFVGDPMVMQGNRLAYVATASVVRVVDARPARPRVVATIHVGDPFEIDALALGRDGRSLYVAAGNPFGHDHVVAIRLGRSGRPVSQREVFTGGVRSLAVTPDGSRLVASVDDRIRVYDVRHPLHPRRLASFLPRIGSPGPLVVAPGGRTAYVLGAGFGGIARLDLHRFAVVARRPAASFGHGRALALSPDGSRVVVLTGARSHGTSVLVLDGRLHVRQRLSGPCSPGVVAASTAGPTAGTFYVGDSGALCGHPARGARISPFAP